MNRYEPGVIKTEGPVATQYHCSLGHSWSITDAASDPTGILVLAGLPDRWCSRCLEKFLNGNVGRVFNGALDVQPSPTTGA